MVVLGGDESYVEWCMSKIEEVIKMVWTNRCEINYRKRR